MFADKGKERTAMGQEFLAKGYASSEDKLLRIACDALRKNPTNPELRRGHILGAISGDIAALNELFKPFREQAVERLEGRARSALLEERARSKETQKSSGGQTDCGTQYRHAPLSAGNGSAAASAPNPAAQPAPAPKPTTAGEARAQGFRAANEHALRVVSRLDTFLVNGKKLRDCTVAEAMEWAKAQQEAARINASGARFVLRLSSGMPSNAVFGDYWKGKDGEVDDIFARAQKEYEGWV